MIQLMDNFHNLFLGTRKPNVFIPLNLIVYLCMLRISCGVPLKEDWCKLMDSGVLIFGMRGNIKTQGFKIGTGRKKNRKNSC